MNEHTLKVLEYDKVRAIVASYAYSDAGRLLVRGLFPSRDRLTAARLLSETREFTQILQSGEPAPLDHIPEISQVLEKLSVTGGMLSPPELLKSGAVLRAGRVVKKFFQRLEGKGTEAKPSAPLLCAKADRIRPLKQIEDAIFGAIDDKAEVKDAASPALRKIRKHISRMREEILRRMTQILQDSGFQRIIQEPVITMREDRYVLPLKPTFRQSIQGVVHGQSGSRATLFVEPLTVLEQNNRLAELRMEEEEEVAGILRGLTALLAGQQEAVEATTAALAEIDAVQARARFGIEFNAVPPGESTDGSLRFKSARHPLLVGKYKTQSGQHQIVPNEIVLERGQRALILSGPNAGGKTVFLKTTGLLCLMAQAGLPVTAGEGTELPCFGSVFADIGDEQSLERDLSTFSSHVSRIAEILQEADRDSLVLLDELGSGTEPGEGAALGAAVLESLIERGCVTVVTTHHTSLKLFGAETEGALNAAMEFDPQTLKPTYRLRTGMPGRSYGLDMATRLGVPDTVIRSARARVGRDDLRLETLLEQVEENARQADDLRHKLEAELIAARQEREETERTLKAARAEARDLRLQAKSETHDVVKALRAKLRELAQAAAVDRNAIKKAGAEVEALVGKLAAELPGERSAAGPVRSLQTGETVRITRLNKTGTVLSAQGAAVELDVNGKKIRLPAAEVVPAEAPRTTSAVTVSGWGAEVQEEEGSRDRLNLIGRRVPEGLAELDRFIDRAGLHHLGAVIIIHGLGSGALKAAVTDFLKNHPLVASTRTGEPAEGGAGVTIVELKK